MLTSSKLSRDFSFSVHSLDKAAVEALRLPVLCNFGLAQNARDSGNTPHTAF